MKRPIQWTPWLGGIRRAIQPVLLCLFLAPAGAAPASNPQPLPVDQLKEIAALAQPPVKEKILGYLPWVWANLGQKDEALAALGPSATDLDRVTILSLTAAAQVRAGDSAAAIQTTEQASAAATNIPAATANGSVEQAIFTAAKALALAADDPALEKLAATIPPNQVSIWRDRVIESACRDEMSWGRFTSAAELAAKVSDMGQRLDLFTEAGRQALQTGDTAVAAKVYAAALHSARPNEVKWRSNYYDKLLAGACRYGAAAAAVEFLAKLQPDDSAAPHLVEIARTSLQQADDGAGLLNLARTIGDWTLAGESAIEINDKPAAVELLKKATDQVLSLNRPTGRLSWSANLEAAAASLHRIALAQARAGAAADAAATLRQGLDLAAKTQDPAQACRCRLELSLAQAQIGLAKDAAATLEMVRQSIKDLPAGDSRDLLTAALVSAFIETGDLDSAQLNLDHLSHRYRPGGPADCTSLWAQLAAGQWRKGDADSAHKSFTRTVELAQRDSTAKPPPASDPVGHICAIRTRAGDLEEAQAMLMHRNESLPLANDDVLAIAAEQYRAGDLAGAMVTIGIQKDRNPVQYRADIRQIAQWQRAAGDLAGFFATLGSISAPQTMDVIRVELIKEYAAKGKITEALDMGRADDGPGLREAAELRIKAGDPKSARPLLDQAAALTAATGDSPKRRLEMLRQGQDFVATSEHAKAAAAARSLPWPENPIIPNDAAGDLDPAALWTRQIRLFLKADAYHDLLTQAKSKNKPLRQQALLLIAHELAQQTMPEGCPFEQPMDWTMP